ncbi:porin [Paraburkholderia unamae]|uniref:Porin n=1 Tax=Paraburkholderia unamae TaxID=219649 RepID=A0ABX5KRD7_9BURK|nr:porin [Paraburkholderia unamae]PVX85157.1 putative porin [Paraburkholderia unamae]
MNRFSFARNFTAIAAGLSLAGAAHAQSSVTLYGVLDASVLYLSKTLNPATDTNGGKFIGFGDSGLSPSVFGLKGTEDLGGGLKANFTLESGINMGTGGFNDSNGNLFGRQAWVGMSGGFGDVKLGLQFSPFFFALYDLDPRLSMTGSSLLPWLNTVAATGIFTRNAVSYTSPVLYGLQGSVLYAFGNVPGDFQAGKQVSASLKWQWQDLMVEAAWFDSNASPAADTVPPTAVPFQGRMLGATYRFGTVTAKASFTSFRASGGPSNNLYGGGLDYLITPAIDVNGGVWYMTDRNETSSHAVLGSIGASYSLSKRTSLYAQVGVVHNDGNARLGLVAGEGLSSANTLFAPAGTTTAVNLGVRQLF